LTNCALIGNSTLYGGGAYGESTTTSCTLVNCTVVANSAIGDLNGATVNFGGGGADRCRLINCIAYYNRGAAPENDNVHRSATSYSCTTPLGNGVGNITNAPGCVNAPAGDYRLAVGSLCIDAGTNLTGVIVTDLTGLPRPMDGNRDGVEGFDMGAYEFNPLFFTSITRSNNFVRVSWFDTLPGMKLQTSPAVLPGTWTDVLIPLGPHSVELPLTPTNAIFRLAL
jgi:hypothetical protein